jgi:16S rRNA (guanine966-N2)-methyltransferase
MKMRIISGKFKGRLITVPQSKFVRPMTDRVRETLFNLLNNKIDFEGIKVLDLYSGSGSLGLECLSRGAGEVHFVEKNFNVAKNLEGNIESLDVNDSCRIFKMEAKKFSVLFPNSGYDLILADPPFFHDDIYEVVENLKINKYFKKDGFIIVERSIQTKPKDIIKLKIQPFKTIGDACLYEIHY